MTKLLVFATLIASYDGVHVDDALGRRGVRRLPAETTICSEFQTYVVLATDDSVVGTHSGSLGSPAALEAGCPYAIQLAPGKELYLTLSGFSTRGELGELPEFYYEWDIQGGDETVLSLFSPEKQPRFNYAGAETFFDWYDWPLVHEDAVVFKEDSTGRQMDYYHCRKFCGYEHEGDLDDLCRTCDSTDWREHTDTLMITVSTYASTQTVSGTYVADLIYSASYMEPAELAMIKEMYLTMCEPYSHAPEGWTWDKYRVLESEAVGERDSRLKPYCDWWPGMNASLLDSISYRDASSIPGVTADELGHVSEIALSTRGLRGPLPDSFAATMVALRRLELQNNRISGPMPDIVSSSSALEEVDLSNNYLTGDVPCASHNESSKLRSFKAARNFLSGELPKCFFSAQMPELRVVALSGNDLDSELPKELSEAPKLTALYLKAAGIRGSLDAVGNLSSMGTLDLSSNFLEGSVSTAFLRSMPRLYQLDLSWNGFAGSVPLIPESSVNLRRVDLSHNSFDGELASQQFDFFGASLDSGVLSELFLNDNFFCGELPRVFYDLLMDSHHFAYDFEVSRNRFRCSKESDNQYFAPWAHALEHDFGHCVPVAVCTHLDATSVAPGATLSVRGAFIATTEIKCRFDYANQGSATVAGFYLARDEVRCELPQDAPEGGASVTVAHYCSDFASAATLADFTPLVFKVSSSRSTSRNDDDDDDALAAALMAIAALAVALVAIAALCFIISREKQGRPLFRPLATNSQSPLHEQLGDPGEQTPGAGVAMLEHAPCFQVFGDDEDETDKVHERVVVFGSPEKLEALKCAQGDNAIIL